MMTWAQVCTMTTSSWPLHSSPCTAPTTIWVGPLLQARTVLASTMAGIGSRTRMQGCSKGCFILPPHLIHPTAPRQSSENPTIVFQSGVGTSGIPTLAMPFFLQSTHIWRNFWKMLMPVPHMPSGWKVIVIGSRFPGKITRCLPKSHRQVVYEPAHMWLICDAQVYKSLFLSSFVLVGPATHFNMSSRVCLELEVDSEPCGALAVATVGVRLLSSYPPFCVISFWCRLSTRPSSWSLGSLLLVFQIVRKMQNSQRAMGESAPWTTSTLSTNWHQDNGRRSKMPQLGSWRNRNYLFHSHKIPMPLPSMREDLCLKRTVRRKSETLEHSQKSLIRGGIWLSTCSLSHYIVDRHLCCSIYSFTH